MEWGERGGGVGGGKEGERKGRELRDGVPMVGQWSPMAQCRRVVAFLIGGLAVLKRPSDCCAEKGERENDASKDGSDLPFHVRPFSEPLRGPTRAPRPFV